ncbi:MAG: hypothetical protein HWD59_03575 [Coxiellaceae bacterium]|nr:MAG: hypothetical protein HWD59_03575 [Coxiellaceae bacterium]
MIPHKRKHGEEVQQRTGKWPRQNNPHPHHDQSQQTSFLKQGSSQNQKSKTLHLLNDEFLSL